MTSEHDEVPERELLRDRELEQMTLGELRAAAAEVGFDWSYAEGLTFAEIVNDILVFRAEREMDRLEMLQTMTKAELIEWADRMGYPYRRRGTKAEIVDDLLPYY